jgi:hypothetical protein
MTDRVGTPSILNNDVHDNIRRFAIREAEDAGMPAIRTGRRPDEGDT